MVVLLNITNQKKSSHPLKQKIKKSTDQVNHQLIHRDSAVLHLYERQNISSLPTKLHNSFKIVDFPLSSFTNFTKETTVIEKHISVTTVLSYV